MTKRELKGNPNVFWKEILEGKRLCSDKEADALQNHIKKLRKEYGFRNQEKKWQSLFF
ncbi:hypothetical protein J4410_07120 [Candidatus Woesearchaeota archaeon]|nr:hypothetical protein [Candidatus Woesearchaeota archaeon]